MHLKLIGLAAGNGKSNKKTANAISKLRRRSLPKHFTNTLKCRCVSLGMCIYEIHEAAMNNICIPFCLIYVLVSVKDGSSVKDLFVFPFSKKRTAVAICINIKV